MIPQMAETQCSGWTHYLSTMAFPALSPCGRSWQEPPPIWQNIAAYNLAPTLKHTRITPPENPRNSGPSLWYPLEQTETFKVTTGYWTSTQDLTSSVNHLPLYT